MRTSARLAVAVLLGASLAGCVAPARNSSVYSYNASQAVDSALSEAQTAHLVIGLTLSDKTLNTYADVVLTSDETAIGPIEDSFGSVQPPSPADDELRSKVLALLGDEEDALADARIAARRSDLRGLRSADARLTASIAHLTREKDEL